MNQEELRSFMVKWNLDFPIDRWWREKHGVAFLSSQHRESSFINQLLEYTEDQLYQELIDNQNQKKPKNSNDIYIPNTNDFIKDRSLDIDHTSEESMEMNIAEFRKEMEELRANGYGG